MGLLDNSPNPSPVRFNSKVEVKPKIKATNLVELVNNTKTEFDWIVNDIIPEKSLSIIAGPSASTKTFLCLEMCLCCCLEKMFLNIYETKKSKILYIDKDNGSIHLARRLKALLKGKGIDINDENFKSKLKEFGFIFHKPIKFNEEGKKLLISLINYYKPDIIVLDSLIRFLDGEENSSNDISQIYEIMRDITENHDVSFLLIHHTKKNSRSYVDDIRGSGDIIAGADMIYMINKNNLKEIYFKQVKNRFSKEIVPIQYSLESDDEIEEVVLKYVRDAENTNLKNYENIALLAEKWFKDDSIKEFKTIDFKKHFKSYKNNATSDALKYLVETEIIEKISQGKYRVIQSD